MRMDSKTRTLSNIEIGSWTIFIYLTKFDSRHVWTLEKQKIGSKTTLANKIRLVSGQSCMTISKIHSKQPWLKITRAEKCYEIQFKYTKNGRYIITTNW